MNKVSDRDIAQLARKFVKQHGQAATDLVASKEFEVLREGIIAGAVICRRLVREIEDLLTLEPVGLLVH